MRRRRAAGQLENQVLELLWSAEGPLGPVAVQAALRGTGHDLAYTTVSTTLARMAAKGLLDRSPSTRGFVYRPSERSSAEAAQRMQELLSRGGGRDEVLSRFVATLSPEDEAALRVLLRRAGGRDT